MARVLRGLGPGSPFAPAIEAPDRLVVPVLVLYEVVRKIRRERGDSFALEAAQMDLPMADSLIYATARRAGATLWTQDEDFASRRGVKYFPKK